MSTGEAFFGGVSAVFGPEMLLVFFALLCGAAVAGSRHDGARRHFALAAVFVVAVGAVWLRADLVPPARFNHWLALVPVLGLAEIRRLRMEWEDWMAPAIALCTAGLVLFWRADRFGPVLSTLRGDWQEPLSTAPRWAYHLGTALALGLVLALLGLGRVPPPGARQVGRGVGRARSCFARCRSRSRAPGAALAVAAWAACARGLKSGPLPADLFALRGTGETNDPAAIPRRGQLMENMEGDSVG